MTDQFRSTYTQIDLNAIRHNIGVFRSETRSPFIAVVKADAYGHGLIEVARTALKEGASMLAVAVPEEGAALRGAGIDAPVLVLGGMNAREGAASVRWGLVQSVYTPGHISLLEQACLEQGKTCAVHIKVDSGMGRLGIRSPKEARELTQALSRAGHVHAEAVFTHFCDADAEDDRYTLMQASRFEEICAELPRGLKKHMSASAAAIKYPAMRGDMVRLGIAMYGCSPYPGGGLDLKPALKWISEVMLVKTVGAGECIGYGCTYKADKPVRVATIAVGYGDGYPRVLSNKGQVLIRGKRCRIIGNVCMDMIMADVTHIDGVQEGDEAVLLGQQGSEEITADEIAGICGTISYEILLAPKNRVPRSYID